MHKVVLQTAKEGKSKMTLHELSAKLDAAQKEDEEKRATRKANGEEEAEGDGEGKKSFQGTFCGSNSQRT